MFFCFLSGPLAVPSPVIAAVCSSCGRGLSHGVATVLWSWAWSGLIPVFSSGGYWPFLSLPLPVGFWGFVSPTVIVPWWRPSPGAGVVQSPGGWCWVASLVLPAGAVVAPTGAVVAPPGAVVVPPGVVVSPGAVTVRSPRGAVSSVVVPAGVRGRGVVSSCFTSAGWGTVTLAGGRLSFLVALH